MKTKKVIFLLVVLMCVQHSSWAQTKVLIGDLYYNFSGVSASVAPNYGDYSWSYNDSFYTNDTYIIPEKVTYDGLEYIVTDIGVKAFAGADNSVTTYNGSTASSIVLPSSVKSIKKNAFRLCKNLKNIDLGGAEIIGDNAFSGCSSLSFMIIPSSLNTFGQSPFEGCNLLRSIIYLPPKLLLNGQLQV